MKNKTNNKLTVGIRMTYTMRCRSVGNPDHGQYLPISNPTMISALTLSELREQALAYIATWSLGGGNWPNCKVKQDGKIIGLMSYNGRFWTTEKDWQKRKEINIVLHSNKNTSPEATAVLTDVVATVNPKMNSMKDVVDQCVVLKGKNKEHLMGFYMNARNQLIAKEIISIGTLTATLAHPREIFEPALRLGATGIIVVHNHPSGDPTPSEEDVRLTKRLTQAGRIMGVELLDHLIIANNGCYSFKAANTL